VMLHETGHFVAAKRFGMKCTQYFIGFGPTIWSTLRGETEYGIKALPLGGFVKITGMTSIDEVDEEDEPRSFRRAPGWQRLIVLLAGSFMHFVLAAVIIFGLALGIGIENNTTQLGTVSTCVPPSEQVLLSGAACKQDEPTSPAALAGLKVGDTVTAFNGVKVTYWTQLESAILAAKPGSVVSFTVDRDGRSLVLHTTLATVPGHGSYLGTAPTTATVFQPKSPLGAIGYVGTGFSEVITGSVSSLAELPAAVPDLFNKQKRASTAAGNVSSVYGAARDTGQAVAADVGWKEKVSFILLLIASLNIFVGVFNLLPLLPMDGGHVAVVLWEMVRSWWARVRRRPNPGLVDYRKLVPLSFGIFVVLVAFGTLLILADIVNPVSIGLPRVITLTGESGCASDGPETRRE
jgi:membrane-associated protease RseP (regulator of RpoE activity)